MASFNRSAQEFYPFDSNKFLNHALGQFFLIYSNACFFILNNSAAKTIGGHPSASSFHLSFIRLLATSVITLSIINLASSNKIPLAVNSSSHFSLIVFILLPPFLAFRALVLQVFFTANPFILCLQSIQNSCRMLSTQVNTQN